MTHPTEQIEAAITGGLTPDEQTAFDEHVAGCPACAALVAEAMAADAAMNELFAGHRPDDDFEERMIQNIRRKQVRITHPLVRRIAVGVAASIVLGGIGYVGSAGINNARLPGFASLIGQRVGAGVSALAAGSDRRPAQNASDGNSGAWVVYGSAPSTQPASVSASRRDFLYRNTSSAGSEKGAKAGAPNGFPADGFDSYLLPTDDGVRYESRFMNNGAANADHGRITGFAEQTREYSNRKLNIANSLNYPTEPDAGANAPLTISPDSTIAKLSEREKETNKLYFKISDRESSQASGFGRGSGGGGGGINLIARGGGAGDEELRRTAGDSNKFSEDWKAKDSRDSDDKVTKRSFDVKSQTSGGGKLGDKTLSSNEEDRKAMSGKLEALEKTVKQEQSETKGTIALVAPDPAKPESQAQAAEAPPTPPAVEPAHSDVLGRPKIIRTGEMDFEVDSFDSTVGIINKVIAEEQGYISTTNSDKLANGKVKGSVVLRVPAEHLDTLVLKLRGIGDLRSQHVNAQDITKQFTDTESALRAAKAMQERLLDIIKNGKGAVKDLLEAEKQLGTWREKVEQLEGEIRYYSNQVSMSTLTLTLFERDIRQPALASENETVTMALETDKVEDAYAKAKDAIAQAKGRIVNSELKQFDAGQFGGTIVAQVPPDAADAVIGRLKQFDGRVARFERQRTQTTSNGNAPSDGRLSADPVKVKREDVTINLTLYNLANVAPRRTTTLTVVAGDVDKAYHALIDQVNSAGGRVVTSQINRAKADQVAGAVYFNVPTEKADALLAALRGYGEVLKTETAESPDTQNVTESKRGFNVTIGSLSAFPSRETQQIQLAATNVPDAFNDLLNALRTGAGRIIASRLNELDRGNTTATLEFEIGRDVANAIEQAMAKDGQVITRQLNRSTDTDNTVDSKVHYALSVASSEQLPPRQTTELSVEVTDVQKAMDDLQAAALAAGGRQVDNPAISQGDAGQTVATLTLDVPLDKVARLIESADGMGIRKNRRTSIDAHAPEGKLARARLALTFATPATLTGSNDGALAGIRSGLGTSMRGLSYSLMLIIIGVCLVAPWALLIGGIWRAVKWAKKNRAPAAV